MRWRLPKPPPRGLDSNHASIVEALKAAGCSVTSLARAEVPGLPDLLVGAHGKNWLLEIKDGSLPPSARKLRESQVWWHSAWRGQVAVVTSVQEALDLVFGRL